MKQYLFGVLTTILYFPIIQRILLLLSWDISIIATISSINTTGMIKVNATLKVKWEKETLKVHFNGTYCPNLKVNLVSYKD